MENKETKPTESGFKILTKIRLSEPLILALFPLTAYLLIFTYYSGYFSVFKLPIQFINFDLGSIFLVSGVLLGFAFTLYYFGDMIFNLLRDFPKPIRVRLEAFAGNTFLFTVFWFLYGGERFNDRNDWLFYWLGVVLIGLLRIDSPLLLLTNKKAYIEKFEAADKRKEKIREQQLKDQEWETALEKLTRIAPEIVLFFFVLGIVFTAGRYEAFQQTEFQVVNTTPERVVLWSTNNYAICAPFDRQTNEVEQSYVVLKIGDDPQIEFRLENLGRLKLNTKSSIKYPSSTPFTRTPTPSPSSTQTPTLTMSPVLTITPSITMTFTQKIPGPNLSPSSP